MYWSTDLLIKYIVESIYKNTTSEDNDDHKPKGIRHIEPLMFEDEEKGDCIIRCLQRSEVEKEIA